MIRTPEPLVLEVLWLAAAAVVFWVVGISKWADRNTTRFIHWLLRRRTCLSADRIENLLLLPNDYQVTAITVGDEKKCVDELLSALIASKRRVTLGVLHTDDTYISATLEEIAAQPTDRILLYGITRDLEALQATMVR